MDDQKIHANEGTEHQTKEEANTDTKSKQQKTSPEDQKAQKIISDLLTPLVNVAETDFDAALDSLVAGINKNPELVEYMAKYDGIQWISLLYTLDRFSAPTRFINILKEKVGIEFDPNKMKKEIGYIEAMNMKSMIKQELRNIMMMSKLKQMMEGAGEGAPGMKIMSLDDLEGLGGLAGLMSPGRGKKPA